MLVCRSCCCSSSSRRRRGGSIHPAFQDPSSLGVSGMGWMSGRRRTLAQCRGDGAHQMHTALVPERSVRASHPTQRLLLQGFLSARARGTFTRKASHPFQPLLLDGKWRHWSSLPRRDPSLPSMLLYFNVNIVPRHRCSSARQWKRIAAQGQRA